MHLNSKSTLATRAGQTELSAIQTGLMNRRWRAVFGGLWVLALLFTPWSAPAQELPSPDWSDPQRPWVTEADRLLRDGELEQAASLYRQLSGEHSQDAALWLRIAYVELQLGRTGSALEAARSAHDLSEAELDHVLMLAQCLVAAGDPQAGLEVLANGLEHHPQETSILESMVSISIGLRHWAEASGLLRELIRLHPERASYQVDLGRILLSNAEADAAQRAFERARELGADGAICAALVGKAHLAAGRLDQARVQFEESLGLRPNGDAHGGLGTIYYLQGERGKALQSFRKAVEMSPNDADLHFNLGNVLAQTDRLEEAEEAYRSSLEIDPFSATTHLNLGVLLLNRFAVEEAQQHLHRAVDLDPALASSYLYLGRIAGASYRYEEAISFYRRYHAQTEDPQEKQRINGVLAELDQQVQESKNALLRGEVHLLQMVCETEEEARRFLDRVRSGEDFFVLAQRQSKLRDIAGVDVGFVDPQSLAARFVEPVEALGSGELTEPIRAENGDYIIFQRVE